MLRFLPFFLLVLLVSSLTSCNTSLNPLGGKDPVLFPIVQNKKFGFINRNGDVVIQPQFRSVGAFSEGVAVAYIEDNKAGFIDERGTFIVNPQFEGALPFSEGLATVILGGQFGYVDKTGKFAINPQFTWATSFHEGIATVRTGEKYGHIDKLGKYLVAPQFENAGPFQDGLASVKLGDKIGFIDREGKFVINPQFDGAGHRFSEGYVGVKVGSKWGYIDRTGKLVINPQFDEAFEFSKGLAPIKMGEKWGYVDVQGKIAINPQFSGAGFFGDDGLALASNSGKFGVIDREGKYTINPQFDASSYGSCYNLYPQDRMAPSVGFSEGLLPVGLGGKAGYVDETGKIVINPQWKYAGPHIGGLACVFFDDEEMGWIDKDGKIIWRSASSTNAVHANNSNSNRAIANAMNAAANADANAVNSMPSSNYSPEATSRTGRLTTDSNIRSEASKDSASLGIHFKGAKVRILEDTSFATDSGEIANWLRVRVYETGCSVNANLGCGKNSPNDSDEGWVNARNVLID